MNIHISFPGGLEQHNNSFKRPRNQLVIDLELDRFAGLCSSLEFPRQISSQLFEIRSIATSILFKIVGVSGPMPE